MKHKKRILSLLLLFMLSLAFTSSIITGNIDKAYQIPDKNQLSKTIFTGFEFPKIDNEKGYDELLSVSLPKDFKNLRLYPGGIPFGVKFYTGGLVVIGFCDFNANGEKVNPAYDAGLRVKDVITKINGINVERAHYFTEAVENSKGETIEVSYTRSGKSCTAYIKPKYSNDESRFKTGLLIKDSGAGIGTVTYINPETLEFGGLGHGICDSDTGSLVPIDRGSTLNVKISGLCKGLPGAPGEIKGYFTSEKTGSIMKNTSCGVFGVFQNVPSDLVLEPMNLATRNEVCEGDAVIYCTLDEGKAQKYNVQISEINRQAKGNKCFTVKITDNTLIEKSGGIIQGMSGSPIIQNGKIIGAVTHVLINDPTSGYGIFIENMLYNAN